MAKARLKKYEVQLYYTAYANVIVEAEDEKDAVEVARNLPKMENLLTKSLEDNGYDVKEIISKT